MTDAEIKRIWDKFTPEGQNMPYSRFRKEMKALTDPVAIRKELGEIQLQKARHRMNQIRIDKAVEGEKLIGNDRLGVD